MATIGWTAMVRARGSCPSSGSGYSAEKCPQRPHYDLLCPAQPPDAGPVTIHGQGAKAPAQFRTAMEPMSRAMMAPGLLLERPGPGEQPDQHEADRTHRQRGGEADAEGARPESAQPA